MRLIHGDCLDVLRTLPDCTVDAVVTDPPAGIAFMGKHWDGDKGGRDQWVAWLAERLAECLRVLKPGGHAVVWALPRTSGWTHRALEDAGFDVRDCVHHLFGCLSEDTEILVDGQWVPYRECAPGRLALCYDNERDEFTWQPIEQVYVYADYCDTAYRLRGDHTDQLVSREHRCLVERGGSYVFERAEDAAQERQARVPVLEDVHRLLAALPLPHQRPGNPQPDLLDDVPCGSHPGGATTTAASPSVPVVRRGVHAQEQPGLGEGEALLVSVCVGDESGAARREGTDASDSRYRSSGMDARQRGVVPGEDDRRAEPGVEGRGHLLPQARQLPTDKVRPLPGGVSADGPQGRLRHGASAPRGASAPSTVVPAGGCASREPRPDGQPAGEPVTVRQQSGAQAVRASRFTRSDLVRIEPVEYSGLIWCVKVPTGAFVARRNGKVFVTGNSGFPKSLDVGKAIDKQREERHEEALSVTTAIRSAMTSHGLTRRELNRACGLGDSDAGSAQSWTTTAVGAHKPRVPTVEQWTILRDLLDLECMDAEVWRLNGRKGTPGEAWGQREVVGLSPDSANRMSNLGYGARLGPEGERVVTAPATPAAQQWDGWGTALKPAVEHWWLARKPLDSTVAGNVTRWGTGALNIDGCRVGVDDGHFAGRWPSDALLSHSAECDGVCSPGCAVAELDQQSGTSTTSKPGQVWRRERSTSVSMSGPFTLHDRPEIAYGDTGGASRFFPTFKYQAKPSTREKGQGLDNLPEKMAGTMDGGHVVSEGRTAPKTGRRPAKNHHPTVKPVELMRWLIRLVTPPGGVILDPFAGSGTTAVAATLEGFDSILIEAEAEYLPLIEDRVRWAEAQVEQTAPTLFAEEVG